MFTTRMDIGTRVAGQPAVEVDEFITRGQLLKLNGLYYQVSDINSGDPSEQLVIQNTSYTYISPAENTAMFNAIYKFTGDGSQTNWNIVLYNKYSTNQNRYKTLDRASMTVHIYKKVVEGSYIHYFDVTYDSSIISYLRQQISTATTYNYISIVFLAAPPTGQQYLCQITQGDSFNQEI